jgi:Fur family transcriptional regulator, ferric uptake regulator
MYPAELIQDLRQHGCRLTPQRQMILSVIYENDAHISAEQILKRVRRRYPRANKSAVYRTLDLLTRLSLVNPTDLGQGCVEYELHRHPHHHHLLCRRCHQMVQADASVFASLEKLLRNRYKFHADLDHFAIYGLCNKCSKNLVKK